MGVHLLAQVQGRRAELGARVRQRGRKDTAGQLRRHALFDLAWMVALSAGVVIAVLGAPRVRDLLGDGAVAVLTAAVVLPMSAILLSLRRLADAGEVAKELNKQAGRDPLTGLMGRNLLAERLGSSLSRSMTPISTRPAVLSVDVDRFARVNDIYGHAAGDAVLKEIAVRLQSTLRRGDVLSRHGGDEFVAVCPVVSGKEAAALAERLLAQFRTPFSIDNSEIAFTASIGVALADGSVHEPELLLKSAQRALNVAKNEGGGRAIVYQASMGDFGGGMDAETRLRFALHRDELRVAYQPIVSLRDGSVVAVEAMLRWDHPERGVVESDELNAILDETGVIVEAGAFLLSEACRQARLWRDMGPHMETPRIYVPVRARQLADPSFRSLVNRSLVESGARPSQLVLVITESALMLDPDGAWARLRDVKSSGVMLALDQ
ncbi:MAG: diguanylate cyclase, partial [Actinobacteria bacterium]